MFDVKELAQGSYKMLHLYIDLRVPHFDMYLDIVLVTFYKQIKRLRIAASIVVARLLICIWFLQKRVCCCENHGRADAMNYMLKEQLSRHILGCGRVSSDENCDTQMIYLSVECTDDNILYVHSCL